MSIDAVAILGGGLMGSGIAESAARAGLRVRVYEPSEGPLKRSRDRIAASVERGVRGGKLDAEAAGELQERISFSTEPCSECSSVENVIRSCSSPAACSSSLPPRTARSTDASIRPFDNRSGPSLGS